MSQNVLGGTGPPQDRKDRRARSLRVAAAAVLAALAAASGAAQVRLPKLEPEDAPAATAADEREDAARALPAAVVICVDRGARRCWSAAAAAQCRSSGAEVFTALARADGSVPHGAALTECWKSVGKPDAVP
jgi:hypothetical protein